KNAELRAAVRTALAGLGPQIVPVLARVLDDPDPMVRYDVAQVIVRLGDPTGAAAARFGPLARSGHPAERAAGIKGLARSLPGGPESRLLLDALALKRKDVGHGSPSGALLSFVIDAAAADDRDCAPTRPLVLAAREVLGPLADLVLPDPTRGE